MREKHVNFGNDATHHVYKWIATSEKINVDGMIRQAFHRAEEEPAEMIEFSTMHTVQEKFSEDLAAWFDDRPWQDACELFGFYTSEPSDLTNSDMTMPGFDEVEIGLLMPLLAMSVCEIRWYAIAEALLRDAGKWNPPDNTLPPEIK